MLQLPRREEDTQPQPGDNTDRLLWLAPVLVLAGLIFLRVALSLSGLVTLAARAGALQGALDWAVGSPQQTRWFAAAQLAFESILGLRLPSGLRLLNSVSLILDGMLTPLLWQAGAAGLYWAALALLCRSRFNTAQAGSFIE